MRNEEALEIIATRAGVKLLPCPFCGECENKPTLSWIKKQNGGNRVDFTVRCTNCNAQPNYEVGSDIDDAIECWNHREIQSGEEIAILGFNQAKEVMTQMLHQLDAYNYLMVEKAAE